jgi:hypothetical protein
VKEFTGTEFLAVLKPFQVQLFGQILLDRRGAALWEGKELAKRVLRAFLPVRRFRRAAQRRLGRTRARPAVRRRSLRRRTPAIFVAVARRP